MGDRWGRQTPARSYEATTTPPRPPGPPRLRWRQPAILVALGRWTLAATGSPSRSRDAPTLAATTGVEGKGIRLFSPPPIDSLSASELGSEPLGAVGRLGDQPHGELAHDGQELGLDAGVHPTAPIGLACDKPVQAFDRSVQPVDGRVVVDPVPGKHSIVRPRPSPLPGRQVNDRTHGKERSAPL